VVTERERDSMEKKKIRQEKKAKGRRE